MAFPNLCARYATHEIQAAIVIEEDPDAVGISMSANKMFESREMVRIENTSFDMILRCMMDFDGVKFIVTQQFISVNPEDNFARRTEMPPKSGCCMLGPTSVVRNT